MSEKGILQTLREVFSFSKTSGPAPESEAEPAGTDVSVEREPSTATEDAVKGTADSGGAGGAAVPEGDGEHAGAEEPVGSEATDGAEEPAESDAGGDPVTEITGIGQTYGDRLDEAGLGTVAALAGSDPQTVADAAEAPESRASEWIEQAQNW